MRVTDAVTVREIRALVRLGFTYRQVADLVGTSIFNVSTWARGEYALRRESERRTA